MNKYRKCFFLPFLLLITTNLYAQLPGGSGGTQNMNSGHFYGRLVNDGGEKGIEGASVQLLQTKLDTATKKRKDYLIVGMLTDKKGEFSLENLNVMATYKLRITAIGYKTIEQKLAFNLNFDNIKNGDYSSLINAVDKDLGNIKMVVDQQQLDDVTVTAEKPLVSMSIDRKVFNVEKNLTSIGGTAQDVMKNVPGVSVDVDGNVTLRNAPPQIFIDGRPSTLTLDQIPADEIESVEIITNPSAKFDASGGGSGILNIVLKKNRKPGYNGNLRAGIDSRAKPFVGGNINVKEGKFNFFGSGQLSYRKSITTASTYRQDFVSPDTTVTQTQNDKPINEGYFAFGRIGLDYLIDNRNTLTIGGNIVNGHFNSNDLFNITRDTTGIFVGGDNGTRSSATGFNFKNLGGTLSFKHNFAKANKNITADLNYSHSKNDNNSNYTTQYFNSSYKTPFLYQSGTGGGSSDYFTAQTDFVNPVTAKIKIEMGARAAIRNFTSFSDTYSQDSAGAPNVLIPALSNNYVFNDQVYAAYATFSQQIKKFNYQAGLRVESSQYSGTLTTNGTNAPLSNQFPLSLFPSVYTTYKLTDKQDVQLNYSRKINRPSFFQLLPFTNFSDSLNLTRGNPNLVPEFDNLFEFSYENQFNNKQTLLATVYLRTSNNLLSTYQYKAANFAGPDSVTIITYGNAKSSYTWGVELISKNKLTDWWDVTTDFNFYDATINASNLPGGIDTSQFSWFAKISNNFKFPKSYSIQLSGTYNAKTIIPQSTGGGQGPGTFGQQQPNANGYIKPFGEVEVAIKKDFLKNNAASLTLAMSDIFRTKTYESFSQSQYYIQDNYRLRDPQVVRLTFSWRFGKVDANLFKRKNMKAEIDNIQNTIQSTGQ
ncbi:MAG TPA: TonB-dependent receptor [Ferruginibacter sp.]|nr:TonB-dependent receptor [Ferruginibacter sp.]